MFISISLSYHIAEVFWGNVEILLNTVYVCIYLCMYVCICFYMCIYVYLCVFVFPHVYCVWMNKNALQGYIIRGCYRCMLHHKKRLLEDRNSMKEWRFKEDGLWKECLEEAKSFRQNKDRTGQKINIVKNNDKLCIWIKGKEIRTLEKGWMKD